MPALTNDEMQLPVWAKYGLSCIRRRWPEANIVLDTVEEDRERIMVRMEFPRDGAYEAHTSWRFVFREKHITYHQEVRNRRLGPKLPVRELNRPERRSDAPIIHRRNSHRRYPNGEVNSVERPETVVELMGQRRELLKKIRAYEIDFAKTLDWGEQAVLQGLREQVSQLEINIIVRKEEAEEEALVN